MHMKIGQFFVLFIILTRLKKEFIVKSREEILDLPLYAFGSFWCLHNKRAHINLKVHIGPLNGMT